MSQKSIIGVSVFFACAASACGSSGDKLICGPGALRDGNRCVPRPLNCGQQTRIQDGRCAADPAPALRCGVGTHRAGSECLPDGPMDPSFTSTTAWSANVRVSEPALDFATETAMAVDSRGNIAIAAIIFE